MPGEESRWHGDGHTGRLLGCSSADLVEERDLVCKPRRPRCARVRTAIEQVDPLLVRRRSRVPVVDRLRRLDGEGVETTEDVAQDPGQARRDRGVGRGTDVDPLYYAGAVDHGRTVGRQHRTRERDARIGGRQLDLDVERHALIGHPRLQALDRERTARSSPSR